MGGFYPISCRFEFRVLSNLGSFGFWRWWDLANRTESTIIPIIPDPDHN